MHLRPILLPFLALTASLVAQQAPEGSPPEDNAAEQAAIKAVQKALSQLKWQTGVIALPNGVASLNLPDGYRFLDSQGARQVIENIWGNPPGAARDALGMIFPRGQEPVGDGAWGIVVTFEEDGYVSDSDADKINYNDLLKEMIAGSKVASAEREKAGYGKMLLTGWALPPRYDKEKKVMYWAKKFDTEGESGTVNYDVRVLGRRGVLSLNGIAEGSQASEIDAATPEIVGLVQFHEGHRYADFNSSTDKKADYTLAGLIVGGAVATKLLAKGGFAVLLAKFGKILIVPFLVAAAYVKRLFGKKA